MFGKLALAILASIGCSSAHAQYVVFAAFQDGKAVCPGSPSAGDEGCEMADGSIYAGVSPDGGVAMFTTPADAPSLQTWSDGTANWTDTAMSNCTDTAPGTSSSCQTGNANTGALVALNGSGSPAPYVAAEYCDGLSAHGHSDWYLPAQDELAVLEANKNEIGGFTLSGYPAVNYWSSSEHNNLWARRIDFGSSLQSTDNKINALSVRCVRKS